jgi:hypothetical protein
MLAGALAYGYFWTATTARLHGRWVKLTEGATAVPMTSRDQMIEPKQR